jgi:hypothetical protein
VSESDRRYIVTSRRQVGFLFIRRFENERDSIVFDASIEVVYIRSIDTCSVCARCVCRHGRQAWGFSTPNFDADRRVSPTTI